VPLVPVVPDDPLVPDVPLVPLEPDVPCVPLVPLLPLVPLVPVPPLTLTLNPETAMVFPELSYKYNVVSPELYVPPVMYISGLNSTHLALSLVIPLIPSMVDPVQAFNKLVPSTVLSYT